MAAMAEPNEITDIDKLGCIRRELSARRRQYPHWVAEKKMSGEQARREIAVMQAIFDEYQKRVKGDDLFSET
jgi:uncharacterized protein YajQ (UPF0234 family)